MTGPAVAERLEEEPAAPEVAAADAPAARRSFAGFTGWRQLALLAASFAIVIVISGALAWRLFPAPDEDSHLFMAVHQAHNLSSPSWKDMEWGGDRSHSYYLYSPIPYYAYAPFVRWQEGAGFQTGASRPDRFIIRMGGVLVFGSAQLALTIWMVRRMLRAASNEVVIMVALAANLMPGLRYTHAYINTDSFTILAGTACFALVLRLWQRDRVWLLDTALVGLAFAAVAHGRYNGFIEAALLGVAFFVFVMRRAESAHVRLRLLGVAMAIPVLLAAPVHLAITQELRNDDILSSTDHDELARSTRFGGVAETPPLNEQLDSWKTDLGFAWTSTWAHYLGYFDAEGGWPVLLGALCVAGVVGLLVRFPELLTPAGRGVGLLAVGGTLLTWLLMISWPYHFGRFLLPAAATALVGVVLGCGVLIQRFTRAPGLLVSACGWVAVLGVLNVVALSSTVARARPGAAGSN